MLATRSPRPSRLRPQAGSPAILLLVLAGLVLLPVSLAACAADPGGTDPAGTETGGTETGDGDHVDRMAAEHEGDEPVEGAARDMTDPGDAVSSERVIYGTAGDRELTGYLAHPTDTTEGLPGILLIHEWWGLNDNIETTARILAHHGYMALAVDLYGVEPATDPEGARELMSGVLENLEPARANLREAHAYLTETLNAPATGVVGWCFGGGWALQSALMIPELDAAVMYYGRVVTDPGELASLEAPLLGLFGAEDRGIPVDGVREMEGALDELGKDVEIVVYDGAGHAFANPSGTRYEPEAAKDAWDRTIAFFTEHLGGAS